MRKGSIKRLAEAKEPIIRIVGDVEVPSIASAFASPMLLYTYDAGKRRGVNQSINMRSMVPKASVLKRRMFFLRSRCRNLMTSSGVLRSRSRFRHRAHGHRKG